MHACDPISSEDHESGATIYLCTFPLRLFVLYTLLTTTTISSSESGHGIDGIDTDLPGERVGDKKQRFNSIQSLARVHNATDPPGELAFAGNLLAQAPTQDGQGRAQLEERADRRVRDGQEQKSLTQDKSHRT